MAAKTSSRCCAPILTRRLGEDDALELASAFKAIADAGRLRLLSFIAGQPEALALPVLRPAKDSA